MARGQLTLHDVPQDLRSKYAARARKTLRDMLTHPYLTPQQVEAIQKRLQWVTKWERADVEEFLPKAAPPALKPPTPTRVPQNHSVELVEKLTVVEKA